MGPSEDAATVGRASGDHGHEGLCLASVSLPDVVLPGAGRSIFSDNIQFNFCSVFYLKSEN